MKVQGREVAYTILTLGFSGYRKAKRILDENELKERIVFSEQILGLMLALPIFSFLIVANSLMEGLAKIDKLPAEIKSWWIDGEMGTFDLMDGLFWIPQSYLFFLILHLYLGVAFFQHSHGIQAEDRMKVLFFGFYALDWDLSKHLEPTNPIPESLE
ncbi:hypothetical protein [Puniceicoccus vermicola]|uniref:Uncharacterized protein n=1 Tax=Puniceicoccus vermicola TaxID=388746 RepID=A0A7X1AXH4_9BACT|nr:hypothetical protein [Puniceicoccus vermicola]MBC2601667.1 hypothetical protein [Puniceicoccus vermicola]